MYRARQVPDFKDLAAVRVFLQAEHQAIAASGSDVGDLLQLSPTVEAPAKVKNGDVRFAPAGTGQWNPGSGPGYYGWRDGAWRFLG